MKVSYEMDFRDVKDLQDGSAHKKTKKLLALAVRDGLRDLDEYHHKRFFLRGSAHSRKTHPTKITSRTGNLAKSYKTFWRPGQLFGYYGTPEQRAPVLEEGMTIRAPAGKALAIPTPAARKGGFTIKPSLWPDGVLFIPNIPGGGSSGVLAMIGAGGKLEVMFILVKQVKIPPRPTVKKSVRKMEPRIRKRFLIAAHKGMSKN